MRFLPREEKFFALYLEQVKVIRLASRMLLDAVQKGNAELERIAGDMRALENKGDDIAHDIFNRLNQTFITPLDPEDIHNLASRMDDYLNGIEECVSRMLIYGLEPVPPTVVAMCRVIDDCSAELEKAILALNNESPLTEHCAEISRLQDEAVSILRDVMADIFRNETDAIRLIKIKEVHEMLERTAELCEDVADLLRAVVVKHS